MNVQDFSKRWALHYINPDFMKIPMSSSKVFQGSGFYLNFTLKNSPHPEAKWCVVDFYIRNVETDEYIYFDPIEDNEVFVNGLPNLNKIPNSIKEAIDTTFLFGFQASGRLNQVLADKYYHGDFELWPSYQQALHSLYIELPPGKFEYTEYSCAGGYLNRKTITLVSDPQLKPILVNIPHKALYQVYQLDTGWKEFSETIDCGDTSFEKYEDDPQAVITTNQYTQERILNRDYSYNNTSYMTSYEVIQKSKQILEKSYNFNTRQLDESFHQFDYSFNSERKTNVGLRSETYSKDDFTPYEYAICNWKYDGEQEIDTSYSGGRFGGGQWNEKDSTWSIYSIVYDVTGDAASNIPPSKKYVIEDTLYKVTQESKTLSYPINIPPLNNNMISNLISNNFVFYFEHSQSYTTNYNNSFVNYNTSGGSNILYRPDPIQEEISDLYAYQYYHYNLPFYVVDQTDEWDQVSKATYISNSERFLRDYSSVYTFDIEDTTTKSLQSRTYEWYFSSISPLFTKHASLKKTETRDNNLDTISYTFFPGGTRFYFYYHEIPGLYLLDNFKQLNDEKFYDGSDVYMDSPSLSLIGNSAPTLHVKDSFRSDQGTIVIDQTLYNYNWKPVSLDKIWRSEIYAEGHGFYKHEHRVPTEDGHWEQKEEWDYFYTNDSSQYDNTTDRNFYFETSVEYNYNEHWVRERIDTTDQIDTYRYASESQITPAHENKGIATYKGRHWSAMVSKMLPANGWTGITGNQRLHNLFAVNLTRGSNVAQTFNLYTGQIYDFHSAYIYDYLEGEYYWNCLAIIGMINSIYKYYSRQEFLQDTTWKDEPIHYETEDSFFYYTLCANEIKKYYSTTSVSPTNLEICAIPWILTPDYYKGHDLSKTKDFKGFLFFGEKLKNKPKIKARQT